MVISGSDRDSEACPVMLALLVVACFLSRYACFACCCLLPCPLRTFATQNRKCSQDRNGARPTNDSALERSPYCLGWVFFRCGIPGLEGSDPRKVVQKHSISPRGRQPGVPGPPLGGSQRISEQRSLILSSVLGQASHRIIIG